MASRRLEDMLLHTPPVIEIPQAVIERILTDAGIDSKIVSIGPPHAWIMQSQKIRLEDGRTLLVKAGIHPDWTTSTSVSNQVAAASLVRSQGLASQPEILSYSSSSGEYGFLYILSESFSGEKLSKLYREADPEGRLEIYRELGRFYSRIHSLSNDWSGIWAGTAGKALYPIHPAQFYLQAELEGAAGLIWWSMGCWSRQHICGFVRCGAVTWLICSAARHRWFISVRSPGASICGTGRLRGLPL